MADTTGPTRPRLRSADVPGGQAERFGTHDRLGRERAPGSPRRIRFTVERLDRRRTTGHASGSGACRVSALPHTVIDRASGLRGGPLTTRRVRLPRWRVRRSRRRAMRPPTVPAGALRRGRRYYRRSVALRSLDIMHPERDSGPAVGSANDGQASSCLQLRAVAYASILRPHAHAYHPGGLPVLR